MIDNFLVFLAILFGMAAFFRQDFVFTVFYLMAGVYIFGSWWSRKAIAAVTCQRELTERAFLDEEVPVKLQVHNRGWLPVAWMRVYDSLPVELSSFKTYRQIITLGAKAHSTFEYSLFARKRGYYRIGPLLTTSGDLLGLTSEVHRQGASNFLTVYPKIISLPGLKLPSNSPMGTLRHTQPIYEDPSRVLSKRDYVAGDSLRRVDWKSSAVTGRLQVKQYEPSIALETVLFLNLNLFEYEARSRIDATELGIVVAASISSRVSGLKQSVGLITNGVDPLAAVENEQISPRDLPMMAPIPARKGQSHLMRILDLLARVQGGKQTTITDLIHQQYLNLPWGTTVVVITGQANEALFDTLFQVRRAGLNVVLVLVGPVPNVEDVRRQAHSFKLPVYFFLNEHDLDIWRK